MSKGRKRRKLKGSLTDGVEALYGGAAVLPAELINKKKPGPRAGRHSQGSAEWLSDMSVFSDGPKTLKEMLSWNTEGGELEQSLRKAPLRWIDFFWD